MEQLVSNLLRKFEGGTMSRRELVHRLTFLAAAGAGVPASGQNQGFQGGFISHVSLSVSDIERSAQFYRKTFGLAVLSEDKKQEIVRLGKTRTLVSLRRASPAGVVDHFAIGVEGFNRDAVTRDLAARGVVPAQNVEAGFHVNDPDGYPVQID
jgi:catechol 2,3-dioxygenase-like lactoylglutathione lyase family enzyme